jgi:hypothetical protein
MLYNKNGITINSLLNINNENKVDISIGNKNMNIRKKPSFIRKLIITEDIILKTKAALIEAGERRKEGLVFWSGTLDGDIAYIKTVICPKTIATSVSARLDNEGIEYIHNIIKKNREFLFVQVHSHPGIAFHSEDDNNEAISYKTGFISIVVPYFGKYMENLSNCAVFEHIGNSVWKDLNKIEVRTRFQVI